MARFDLVAVIGPTASGKTAFAAHFAKEVDGEIISADSRQVYRNMNLGTGKDYHDYVINNIKIPYHLIDIAEPGYKYNIFEFQKDFNKAYQEIRSRGKLPVLCGGSGLYIQTVIRQYRLLPVPIDPGLHRDLANKSLDELTDLLVSLKTLHNRTDTDTKEHAIRAIEIEHYTRKYPEIIEERSPMEILYLGIRYDRSEERLRITQRLHARLKQGLVEEVKMLLENGLSPEKLIYYGLEYKYVTQYLTGLLTYEDMVNKLNTAINQFAKRQMTWFRKMEREGADIHWIDASLPMKEKIRIALQFGLL